MKKFETIKIDRTQVSNITLLKDGMEIECYIAGVNSGVYGLPFVVSVKTWASKWFFKKFFRREMKLNIHEVKALKEELEKVISFYEKKNI